MSSRAGANRRASRPRRKTEYHLWLYIAGSTSRSTNAILNIMKFCKTYLEGRYHLEIVDVFQHPEIASREQIIATPTLVRRAPAPRRILVGDLSDTPRVLAGLEVEPTAA